MNRPDLLADERFTTNNGRTKYLDDLIPVLDVLFARKPARQWLDLLEAAGVPAAPVNSIDMVMEDRQLKARNMFLTVEDDVAGTVTVPGNPIKMESLPETPDRPHAPAIGEHTDKILTELLGLSAEAIKGLRDEGVI